MKEIKVIGTKPSKTMVKGFNPTNTLRLEIHNLKKKLNLIRINPNRLEEYKSLEGDISSYLTLIVRYHQHGDYLIITEEVQDTHSYATMKAEWDRTSLDGYLPTTLLFRMYAVDVKTGELYTGYKDTVYKMVSWLDETK